MNGQLFNVLAQKTRGNLFQTVKNMSEEELCYGAGAWVQLLRSYMSKNACRSQRLTGRVHDIKCVSSCSVVLARMEIWSTALKEHVKDIGCEVADITTGFHLIFLQSIVRYSNVNKYTIDQVGLRLCYDQKRPKRDPNGVKPMETSLAEHVNDDETGEDTWQ